MDKPSVLEDLAVLRRVIGFGQELAGTLRRASVVDALLRHVRENLAPTEIALSLFHQEVDAQDSLHAWPPTFIGRSDPSWHASAPSSPKRQTSTFAHCSASGVTNGMSTDGDDRTH